MGIADDISPRQEKRATPSGLDSLDASRNLPIEEDRVKSTEVEAIFKPKPATNDGFFPPSKTAGQKKADIVIEAEPAKPEKSLLGRILNHKVIVTLLLIVVAGLIYQYRGQIKKLISGDSTTSTSNSDAVTIVPQDYTSGASTPASSTDSSSSSAATSTPASTEAAAPAATTPTATDKTTLTIDLLNGNGIRNYASGIKKTLTEAGYTVTAIGNAKNFAYASTYIYYKTGFKTAATELKSVLSTRSITVENNDTICKTYDIVIIIGKK